MNGAFSMDCFLSKERMIRILGILLLVLAFFFFFSMTSLAADTAQGVSDQAKNVGFFSGILNYFKGHLIKGGKNLMPVAISLSLLLMTIQIATTWTLYEGQLRMFELIKEVIRFSFILFLIYNFEYLANTFIEGWMYFGGIASGIFNFSADAKAIAAHPIYNPSHLVDVGWACISQVFAKGTSVVHPINSLLILVCGIVAYIGVVFIALQITITLLEYYMVTCLGVILLPFGLLRYTHFLYNKLIQGIFTFGIKLMVVYFIAGLGGKVLDDLGSVISKNNASADADRIVSAVDEDIPGLMTPEMAGMITGTGISANSVNFGDVLNFMLLFIIMGYLVWKIPSLVAAMISGSPQMEAGAVAGTAMGFAAGAVLGSSHLAGNVAGTWAATSAKAGEGVSAAVDKGGGAASNALAHATQMPGSSGSSPVAAVSSGGGKDNSQLGDEATNAMQGSTSIPAENAASAPVSAGGSEAPASAGEGSSSGETSSSSQSTVAPSPSAMADQAADKAASTQKSGEMPSGKPFRPARDAGYNVAYKANGEFDMNNDHKFVDHGTTSYRPHIVRFASAMLTQGIGGSAIVQNFLNGSRRSAQHARDYDGLRHNYSQYVTNSVGYRNVDEDTPFK
uniref:type IV secretion system protein n=1 Tax=Dialister sp. TaxID=1955814 RepID=UPI00402A163E